MPAKAPTLGRFWAKVIKGPSCWEYTASKDTNGYGLISDDGKHKKAHRYSYEIHVGPIPKGLIVRHKCDNRWCVNPDHLELGTDADNMQDRDSRGRCAKGETSGKAILTEAKVREIRQLRNEGMSCRALAKMFGTNDFNISWIARRKGWKHVN